MAIKEWLSKDSNIYSLGSVKEETSEEDVNNEELSDEEDITEKEDINDEELSDEESYEKYKKETKGPRVVKSYDDDFFSGGDSLFGSFTSIVIGLIGIVVVIMVGYTILQAVSSSLGETESNASESLGIEEAQPIIYLGFAILAVGIIVVALFGLINIFR